jgi:autoinducer 2-degrading protein
MEFQSNQVDAFLEHFEEIKTLIRNFPGCSHLELYRDKNENNIFFTYSKWEQESDLENYRKSALFNEVWAVTKPKFAKKAEAWSVDTVNN